MAVRICWLAILLLGLWPCALQNLSDAVATQVQTNIYKGLPDKWASGIENDPFVKIGQNYYYFEVDNKLNWYNALHACVRRNAQLVGLVNFQEWDPVIKYILEKKYNFPFWTSGTDLGSPGTYYWLSTGEKISWVSHVDHPNEDCLSIQENPMTKKWIQYYTKCSNTYAYICKAETPKTIAVTIF